MGILARIREQASRFAAWLDRLPPLLEVKIEITVGADRERER